MMNQHQQLADILLQIEQQMQQLQLWQKESPSAAALASQQPFAVDTLSFFEWCQWIMLPRFRQMISAESALPANCNIAPMAETVMQQDGINKPDLLNLFHQLDQTLNGIH